jgi:hypothetical protein
MKTFLYLHDNGEIAQAVSCDEADISAHDNPNLTRIEVDNELRGILGYGKLLKRWFMLPPGHSEAKEHPVVWTHPHSRHTLHAKTETVMTASTADGRQAKSDSGDMLRVLADDPPTNRTGDVVTITWDAAIPVSLWLLPTHERIPGIHNGSAQVRFAHPGLYRIEMRSHRCRSETLRIMAVAQPLLESK